MEFVQIIQDRYKWDKFTVDCYRGKELFYSDTLKSMAEALKLCVSATVEMPYERVELFTLNGEGRYTKFIFRKGEVAYGEETNI